ncbi:MAG: hypothetical protein QOD71_2314 [Thermoleophilaceae bacterium]|jgi:hypothetical protein|nr:hypothetical protein [Thermoleophilaceae bacterium]
MSLTSTHASHDRPTQVDERGIGAASIVVALASLAFANFGGSGGDGGTGPFLATAAFSLIVAAIVFGWAVPRANAGGTELRTAVVLALLSVIGLAAFWSGLPQVVAPAAALLAYTVLQRDGSRRAAPVALIAVSMLAYLAAIVGCVAG